MALNLNPVHGPVPKSRIFAVLAMIILLSEIASFEFMLVIPDLPHLAQHFRTLNIAWAFTIVLLVGATIQPLVGKASDKWGKKNTIVALSVVFVAGSVLCALATDFSMLLVGRALQGSLIGAVGVSYGLVRDIIPRETVPVALGAVVTGIGMSAVAGPFIAGWLIDGFGPQSVFWFMAIYVVVLLPIYIAIVPESDVRVDKPVDYLGIALLGPGIGVLLLALTEGADWGWSAAGTLGLFLLGAVMLIAFVIWERRTPNPVLDLKILFGRKFGPTVLAVACISYMMNADSMIRPTMLEMPHMPGISYGAGLSVLDFAIWTVPMGVVGMFAGPLGGYLSKKIGAKYVLIASAVLFLIVMLTMSALPVTQWQISAISFLAGFAIGFLHSSNGNLTQDALPKEQGGIGNTIAGMSGLLAGSIATAVTGVVMAQHVLMVVPTTHTVIYKDEALTQGYYVAVAIGVVGLVIALVMRHGSKPARGGLVEGEGEGGEKTSAAPTDAMAH
ncbi:MFS transporter [Rhodococcus sp. D2-41]|uniref:MFS transporter n=1 Tax=Speluncibacter jeojiensis TaxID=2710754 RepID=A0A9X4M251_9ACTN|nr:MFS transporter [Rhodococcus sp. D2-41]MDG3009519.1 MFS transporter [Rhodococcus sp. D2-41]MDG3016449.1 MFS transporter [Corynebacteriales bacterium D3-21]